MPSRTQSTTPFKSGGNSSEHEKSGEKVKVHYKMAKARNAGQPDPLSQALVEPPRVFKDTMHFLKRPVEIKGHSYKPHWEPIKGRTGVSGTSATDYKSHSSKSGSNAVGSNANRKGDNPLGRAMNKVGSNALGNHGNRIGSKTGYPSFTPRGGGKNV